MGTENIREIRIRHAQFTITQLPGCLSKYQYHNIRGACEAAAAPYLSTNEGGLAGARGSFRAHGGTHFAVTKVHLTYKGDNIICKAISFVQRLSDIFSLRF